MSQISCAVYSLESRAGVRYSVDSLPREDGSAHLVTTPHSLIFVTKGTRDVVWVLPASEQELSAAVKSAEMC